MSESVTRQLQGIPFTITRGDTRDLFFVLGIRKSGSSIFNNICNALANFNNLPFIDIPGTMFKAGKVERDWQADSAVAELLAPGNVYGGFRSLPEALATAPQFRSNRKVVLVRDPRDALISEYFSNAFSHTLPSAGAGRDQFQSMRDDAVTQGLQRYVVDRINSMAHTCAPFVALAADPTARVFRYEDVIFEKPQLMRDVCAHFGWDVTQHQIDQVMTWADKRPTEERPTEFVRRVTPGDYINKMSPDVQRQIIDATSDFSRTFGYTLG